MIDYDQMDWLSYGNSMKKEGDREETKKIAERMIARSKETYKEIAEITGLTGGEVEELAGIKPA